MSLFLKANLPFEREFMFAGFLPVLKDVGLNFRLREGKYKIIIYMSDRRRQLHNVSEVPEDPEELKKYMNLYCGSLTMEIEVLNPDSDITNALEAHNQTEKTEAFGKEVFNIIAEVNNAIIYYLRNIAGQYWLEPFIFDPRNFQDYLDFKFNVRWCSSTGEWKRFNITREKSSYAIIHMPEDGINLEMWRKISSFIEEKKYKKIPDRKILISNSRQHLSQGNDRIAIIEAVIAWETTVKNLLPKILSKLRESPEIREVLKLLMRKNFFSLRIITYVGLRLIKNSLGLDIEDIIKINKAVLVRNSIVHGPTKVVEIPNARRYISAIRKVIRIFENQVA